MIDKIERIHKEVEGEKEGGVKDEGSEGDNDGGKEDGVNDNAGEEEEREGATSLKDTSNDDKIYGAISSGQGTTTTNAKSAKDNDDKDGCTGVIHQFWVCAMGHMEDVAELIMEMDIYCLEHLTDITCLYFEGGTGFELRFNFDIKTNKYFTYELLIMRYKVPNLLLDNEPILKNVMGCNIHWKEDRSLKYRDNKKNQKFNIGRREGQIHTVNKRERTNLLFHFFMLA